MPITENDMSETSCSTQTPGIGIDTGGTYTDSVIVGLETGNVISKAKALTTPRNLGLGIRASLEKLDASLFGKIKLVALSTTLATNSVVEGKGARVGLIMVVPKPETFQFQGELPCEKTVLISGSHTHKGEENIPLDIPLAQSEIQRMALLVDAFAVSGYFSIYNAAHEKTLARLILEKTGKPVVCAHELSGAVGMVERAVTAALNARLLPVIRELTGAVQTILEDLGIHAPLMVVKGDGTMMGADACQSRPVETVLSGPAASIAGACRLSGIQDAMVLDMGGTTTDIAVVRNGQTRISIEGARVGGWQTRVRAVDMWTLGLGGDSRIVLENGKKITIGPGRVIPFSHAGTFETGLGDFLKSRVRIPKEKIGAPGRMFLTLRKNPEKDLSESEKRLMERLDKRVLSLEGIQKKISPFIDINGLVRQGVLMEVGFTPTDLLHTTGQCSLWDRETAEAGLLFWAHLAGISPSELQERIKKEFDQTLALHMATKCLQEDTEISELWDEKSLLFMNQLLGRNDNGLISIDFLMKKPVVAVGAPVHAHLPRAAKKLQARLVIAPHAEVANAYGAITGKVVETVTVIIRPASSDGYVLVAPSLQKKVLNLADAIELAESYSGKKTAQRVIEEGGENPKIDFCHETLSAPLAEGWGDPLLIEMRVIATASGSPAPDPTHNLGLFEPTYAKEHSLNPSFPGSD